MKKYKLLKTDKKTWDNKPLFQIQALVSFGTVKKGDKGGFIEKEANLEVSGDAWVFGNAQVSGDAWVCFRGELTISIDYELTPFIKIDTAEKAQKLKKALEALR